MSLSELINPHMRRSAILRRMADQESDWIAHALLYLTMIPEGASGTSRWYQQQMLDLGCRPPPHFDRWGPFMVIALNRGYVTRTGEWRVYGPDKDHANARQVYVRSNPAGDGVPEVRTFTFGFSRNEIELLRRPTGDPERASYLEMLADRISDQWRGPA